MEYVKVSCVVENDTITVLFALVGEILSASCNYDIIHSGVCLIREDGIGLWCEGIGKQNLIIW